MLFTYELQRRFEAADISAIATAAHPGISDTNLANHLLDRWYFKIFEPVMRVIVQSAALGALPSLRAAVDPDVVGGEYFGPDGPNERNGYPVVVQSSEVSHSLSDAHRLWEVSEALTGIRYLSNEIILE